MLKKRIIACLDIKDGRTVKGTHFSELKDAGDAVELAKKYVDEGIDELVFLDISATQEKRKTLTYLVEKIASTINIPFTVGGGITSVEDARILFNAGADKVSINSSAITHPGLLTNIAMQYGSQSVVVAIDVKRTVKGWMVFINGGKTPTPFKAVDWAIQAEQLGAGEILLTSMNADGTKNGFNLDISKQVSSAVNIPVIASGGAGTFSHFKEVFEKTGVSAALAASVFHYNDIKVSELKTYLQHFNINIRS